MSNMIESGYFTIGESFYSHLEEPVATLEVDGKLSFSGVSLDMHTLAGQIKGNASGRLNGFDYWRVMRNNKLIKISEVRTTYRKNELDYEELTEKTLS